MKALSLWQPWASLMAAGFKKIETRDWPTRYRGPLAIHAAKRPLGRAERDLIEEWLEADLGISLQMAAGIMPFGALLCVVQLYGCVRTEVCTLDMECEREFGNYAPGRWAWLTAGLRALPQPIPYRGAQGLFEVPDSISSGKEA